MKKIKPLHKNVVIKQHDLVREEKTKSGIVLLQSDFNQYQFGDDNQRVTDIISKKKQNKGTVVSCGEDCGFTKKGDTIIYKKQTEKFLVEDGREELYMVDEKHVLVKEANGKYVVNDNYVLVKITKESRDSVFEKKIRKDDGTLVDLCITVPPDKDMDRYAQFFVSTGEVMAVGAAVKNVLAGDLAIIDYLVDNDESIIVGYEGEDKLVAVQAVTIRHEEDSVAYASRNSPKDQIIWCKGDYDLTTKIIGVLRGEELISLDPFVFLAHQPHVFQRETKSGITYEETTRTLEREVLAVSERSSNEFGLQKGNVILCHEYDVFNVIIGGKTICVINDADILALLPSKAGLKAV
jgi:co-chaperonin GroES (HSP10)